MPRRLSKSRSEDFEPRKRNPLGLLGDSNLDSHLKSLKIGEKNTPIQLSDKEVRFEGDFFLNGKLSSNRITTDNTYLNISANNYLLLGKEGNPPLAFSTSLDGDAQFTLNSSSSGYHFYGDEFILYRQNSITEIVKFEAGDMRLTGAAGNYLDLTCSANGEVLFQNQGSSGYGLITLKAETNVVIDPDSGITKFQLNGDTDDLCTLTVEADGVTTIATADSDGELGHLNIEADGNVEFDKCAFGFDKLAGVFSTSGEIEEGGHSTDIDFRLGNKYELELTDVMGLSDKMNLIFPATSGNFILVLIQDGSGSRTVHGNSWVGYAHDETACDNLAGSDGTDGGIRWAGGTAPTLTTTANKSDIISIYWDADNQTAFATITYNF